MAQSCKIELARFSARLTADGAECGNKSFSCNNPRLPHLGPSLNEGLSLIEVGSLYESASHHQELGRPDKSG